MANIIIHLTRENIQDLILNRDIVVGPINNDADLSITVPAGIQDISFFTLFDEQIEKLKKDGNLRTAETYAAALNKLRSFREEKDLMPSEITPELMESFQNWLKNHHLSMNTISFHMRKLRAVYNKAVEQGLTADLHPFRHVYTGIAKTSKPAINISDLKRIKELQLDDPMLEYARDMFLFSFYTRGMAFVDMAYLRKSDVDGGLLTYRRKKTGQQLTIRWEQSMKEIPSAIPRSQDITSCPLSIPTTARSAISTAMFRHLSMSR